MSAHDVALLPPRGAESGTGRWLDEWGDIVIPVFLLGMLLPVRGIEFLVPTMTLPINTLACVALVLIGVWASSRWRTGNMLVLLSGFSLVFWLVARTIVTHGLGELRRTVNILTLFAITAVIASGRLHIRSLARGIVVGAVVALAVSAAMIPLSNYAGRLTGVLGDPNGAGYVLLALGFAAAQSLSTRRMRLMFWALLGLGAVLTVSRTTIFAFGAVSLWVLLAPRVSRLMSLAAMAGTAALYAWVTNLAEAAGWFAERDGSDDLREALAIQEQQMSAGAGWLGEGLGTAIVDIRGTTLFFHNSYRALQTEGGAVAMVLLLALLVGVFWMFHQLPAGERPVWSEAALLSTLIASFNIGFSLTSPPIAIALGLYLAYHGAARKRLASEAGTDDQ
ncbi:hypothetical protein [Tessaracoccus sp. Z1128]